MAEQQQAPTVPPVADWARIVKRQDGSLVIEFSPAFYKYLVGERGGIRNVNSGVSALAQAQAQAAATQQAQVDAANAAAQAAITASGSTEVGQASFSGQTVNSGTFATYASAPLNHAGGGNYTITAVLGISSDPTQAFVTDAAVFFGEWQIIENPNGHVLVSGSFQAETQTFFGEGGTNFYVSSLTYSAPPFPATPTAYPDNESGAVTIEFQLRRASGTNQASGLLGSILVEWA